MQGSPGPPAAALEEHLVACVQHSLGLGLHDNAAFLAERLVAQFPSEVGAGNAGAQQPGRRGLPRPLPLNRRHRRRRAPPPSPSSQANLFLLATCYHRANQSYRAYHLLKGMPGEQSRYLFALCAMQLGKLTEAESALLPDNDAMRVRGVGTACAHGMAGCTWVRQLPAYRGCCAAHGGCAAA